MPEFRPWIYEYSAAHSGAGTAAITWTLNGESSLKSEDPSLTVVSPATTSDVSLGEISTGVTGLTFANTASESTVKIRVYASSTSSDYNDYNVHVTNTATT